MLDPGTVVSSPRGTVVEIVENTAERFRVRRELPPATGRAASHRHTNGAETFRVLDGEATGRAAGRSRLLREGDVLEVPIDTPHMHPYTASDAIAVVEHTIEPRPRFVEVYFASWLTWLAEGRVNNQDELTPLGIMAILREGGGGTWVAGPPVAAQKALAAVLGRVAARRGYRAVM